MTKAEEKALEAYPYLAGEWMGCKTFQPMKRSIYKKAYEQAEKDLGWVSVKERLPEKEGWYLTCIDDTGHPRCIDSTYRDTTIDKWLDEDGDEVFPHYWMPIPELPKEK